MAIGSSRNGNEPKLFLSGSLFEERLRVVDYYRSSDVFFPNELGQFRH